MTEELNSDDSSVFELNPLNIFRNMDEEIEVPVEEQLYTISRVRQVVSLKENCIDCITKNFDMYNTAFLSTNDASLRRNLQFLQRRYSSRIILDLTEEELLDDRHLDFLINEHLTELDLRILVSSGCTFPAIKSRMAVAGHAFTKVSFDVPFHIWEQNVTEFVNEVICYLPNVEVLHVRQHCNNITLKNISVHCQKLCELNIDGSEGVTDEGMEMLCNGDGAQKLSSLKVLSLNDTTVLKPGIVCLLENMPSLEAVHFVDFAFILYSIHEDNHKNNTLSNIAKYNLNKLDLWHQIQGDHIPKANVLEVWTELCPNVSTLLVSVENEQVMDLISRFSKLEHLTLKQGTSSRMNVNNLLKSKGAKLQSLEIDSFIFSISDLMESCPKLENLVLTNPFFRPFDDTKKFRLNNFTELLLEDIIFSFHNAEDSVNTILLSSPKLEKLTLEQCRFEESEMNTKLAKYCESNEIQHLRFYYCDIDVPLLESIILTCSSLKSLTIDSCENITPDDAYNLQQLKNTTRSIVEIKYIDNESDLHSLYSHEDDFYNENDTDDEPDYDGYDVDYDDFDDDDPYLFYDW